MLVLFTMLFVSSFLSWAETCAAEQTPGIASGSSQESAESAFDLGVRYFDDSQFEPAARAFLRADELKRNPDALSNALVAAEYGGNHLLIVEVAERILARESDPGLAIRARESKAKAARHLSVLRYSCTVQPCSVTVDGEESSDAELHVLPGTHRLEVQFKDLDPATALALDRTTEAGTSYRFTFAPRAQSEPEADTGQPAPPQKSGAPDPGSATNDSSGEPWLGVDGRRAILIAGVSTTVVLAGITTWSGVDTLQSYNRMEEPIDETEHKTLKSQMRRTDILLGSTLATAVLSTAWLIWGGPFSSSERPAAGTSFSLVPSKRGAQFLATGTFP